MAHFAIPWILAFSGSGIFVYVGHVQVIATPFHVSRGASIVFLSNCGDCHNFTKRFGKVRTSQATEHERSRESDTRLAIPLVFAFVIFPFTWLPYPIELSIMNLCFKGVFFLT